MTSNFDFSKGFRNLHPGMGEAVAARTILRKKFDGSLETWGDVSHRAALGNSLLVPKLPRLIGRLSQAGEYRELRDLIAKGIVLMSGRHLQHGDELQPTRNMEVFTNCSTATMTWVSLYLTLNGSGVGRSYDDDMMLVNWDNAPALRCVLSDSHPDFDYAVHESVRDAKHKYGSGKDVLWFTVLDSREGWAKALEVWEVAAFEKVHKDKLLILDFSEVRGKGKPIRGMQNRPASGPAPLMNAFNKAATIKGAGLERWKQASYIDHYFAECVLVGGARRSARIATKFWKDRSILDFITIKRPIEYSGMSVDEVMAARERLQTKLLSFLWSANNSVMVDSEFWELLDLKKDAPAYSSDDAKHARAVFKAVSESSYGDGTGEPGLINVDKLTVKPDGWEKFVSGDFIGGEKYQVNDETRLLISRLAKVVKKKKYPMIVNPCSEIALNLLGGFCVIGDVVPFHADTLDEAEEAFRATTRALMRVNLMKSLYQGEVTRTNRIGVSVTGIHEFAWRFFGFGFRDLIDEKKSRSFWLAMARFNRAVRDEAVSYAKELGVNVPHTLTTIKPAGTTSKLFGLTEGWHLPSMAYYLRWVQFRSDDPLIEKYRTGGFPTRDLVQYRGTTIVGFPTAPAITQLGMGDALVTAAEATPEEQYRWLCLGEKYWIDGTDEEGTPLTGDAFGNQISYTLKYDPTRVDFPHFRKMILKWQRLIKCCSVMPQEDTSSYEYLPEERVTKERFDSIVSGIKEKIDEDIAREHVDCAGGACPVDFKGGEKAS